MSMKINTAGNIPKTAPVQGEKVKATLTGTQAAAKEGRTDSLVLSEQAKKTLERLGKETDRQNELSVSISQMKTELENSRKAGKAQAEETENKLKMLEIARRLQHGDKVPSQDERALMEYDDKLYQISKQIGLMKQLEERKEYDTLLDDEEMEDDISPDIEAPAEVGAATEGTAGEEIQAEEIGEVQLE